MSDVIENETVESIRKKYESAVSSQAGSDRKVQEQAALIKNLQAELTKLEELGNEKQVVARIEAIEAGYAKKLRQAELGYYARAKALEAGVSFDLIEAVPFQDEIQVDTHLAKLAAFVEQRNVAAVNDRLMTSAKPMAGGSGANPKRPDSIQAAIAEVVGRELKRGQF